MKCPKCGSEQNSESKECIDCGIIFEKYLKYLQGSHYDPNDTPEYSACDESADKEVIPGFLEAARSILFYVKPDNDLIFIAARGLVLICMVYQGGRFVFSSINDEYLIESFWHLVNLPFHEAGHVIMGIFGHFIGSLGGTLGQLVMPLVCMATFLIKTRDTFAASFCLWWFGLNFMDIAPYIADARSLSMPLLGGNTGMDSPYGFHDWEFILKETGLINYDLTIASLSMNSGRIIVFLSILWGGYLLLKQYRSA